MSQVSEIKKLVGIEGPVMARPADGWAFGDDDEFLVDWFRSFGSSTRALGLGYRLLGYDDALSLRRDLLKVNPQGSGFFVFLLTIFPLLQSEAGWFGAPIGEPPWEDDVPVVFISSDWRVFQCCECRWPWLVSFLKADRMPSQLAGHPFPPHALDPTLREYDRTLG